MLKRAVDTLGFDALVKGRYGYVLCNKNNTYVGRSVEKYGEFSELEVVLFRQLCREGDVVVEVDANIGTHTLALAQLVGKNGRVHAFEPQRIVFQNLCANMALNSIENVECHHAGARAEDGFVRIPDIRYDISGNFGGVAAGERSHQQDLLTVTVWPTIRKSCLIHDSVFTGCLGSVPFPPYGELPKGHHVGQNAFIHFGQGK